MSPTIKISMLNKPKLIELSTQNLHFHDQASVFSLDFDGKYLLTAGGDSTINRWTISFSSAETLSFVKDLHINNQSEKIRCNGLLEKSMRDTEILGNELDKYKNTIELVPESHLIPSIDTIYHDSEIPNISKQDTITSLDSVAIDKASNTLNFAVKSDPQSDHAKEADKNKTTIQTLESLNENHVEPKPTHSRVDSFGPFNSIPHIEKLKYSNRYENVNEMPSNTLLRNNLQIKGPMTAQDNSRDIYKENSAQFPVPNSEKLSDAYTNLTERKAISSRVQEAQAQSSNLQKYVENTSQIEFSASDSSLCRNFQKVLKVEEQNDKVMKNTASYTNCQALSLEFSNNIDKQKTCSPTNPSHENYPDFKKDQKKLTLPFVETFFNKDLLHESPQMLQASQVEVLNDSRIKFEPKDTESDDIKRNTNTVINIYDTKSSELSEFLSYSKNSEMRNICDTTKMKNSQNNESITSDTAHIENNLVANDFSKLVSKGGGFMYEAHFLDEDTHFNFKDIKFVHNNACNTSIKFEYIETYAKHTKLVNSVRYHPSKRFFASCSDGGEVYLWKNGEPISVRGFDRDDVVTLEWAGDLLFLGMASGKVSVYKIIELIEESKAPILTENTINNAVIIESSGNTLSDHIDGEKYAQVPVEENHHYDSRGVDFNSETYNQKFPYHSLPKVNDQIDIMTPNSKLLENVKTDKALNLSSLDIDPKIQLNCNVEPIFEGVLHTDDKYKQCSCNKNDFLRDIDVHKNTKSSSLSIDSITSPTKIDNHEYNACEFCQNSRIIDHSGKISSEVSSIHQIPQNLKSNDDSMLNIEHRAKIDISNNLRENQEPNVLSGIKRLRKSDIVHERHDYFDKCSNLLRRVDGCDKKKEDSMFLAPNNAAFNSSSVLSVNINDLKSPSVFHPRSSSLSQNQKTELLTCEKTKDVFNEKGKRLPKKCIYTMFEISKRIFEINNLLKYNSSIKKSLRFILLSQCAASLEQNKQNANLCKNNDKADNEESVEVVFETPMHKSIQNHLDHCHLKDNSHTGYHKSFLKGPRTGLHPISNQFNMKNAEIRIDENSKNIISKPTNLSNIDPTTSQVNPTNLTFDSNNSIETNDFKNNNTSNENVKNTDTDAVEPNVSQKRKKITIIKQQKIFDNALLAIHRAHSDIIQGIAYNSKYGILATISKDATCKTFAFTGNKFKLIDTIETYQPTQMLLTGFNEAMFYARPLFSHCNNFLFIPNCKEGPEFFVYMVQYPFRKMDICGKIGPLKSACIKIIFKDELGVLICKNDIYFYYSGRPTYSLKNVGFYQLTDGMIVDNTLFLSSLDGFLYTIRAF